MYRILPVKDSRYSVRMYWHTCATSRERESAQNPRLSFSPSELNVGRRIGPGPGGDYLWLSVAQIKVSRPNLGNVLGRSYPHLFLQPPPCHLTIPSGMLLKSVSNPGRSYHDQPLTSFAQVSDDSDIEGHPNVDHKSLVRYRLLPISRLAFAMSLTAIAFVADGNNARFTKSGRLGNTRSPHSKPTSNQTPSYKSASVKFVTVSKRGVPISSPPQLRDWRNSPRRNGRLPHWKEPTMGWYSVC